MHEAVVAALVIGAFAGCYDGVRMGGAGRVEADVVACPPSKTSIGDLCF